MLALGFALTPKSSTWMGSASASASAFGSGSEAATASSAASAQTAGITRDIADWTELQKFKEGHCPPSRSLLRDPKPEHISPEDFDDRNWGPFK